ncbi:MAG: MucBP domain-containing protein [Oscillospiraceae bacterium]|jgi:hypothetical protein|nr:MucBP domain-containing protein [Oscillospiraceae bacterium]
MKKVVSLFVVISYVFCFSVSASAASASSVPFLSKVCEVDGNTYCYRFDLNELLEKYPSLEPRKDAFVEEYNYFLSALGDPTKTILCGFYQSGYNPTGLNIFVYDTGTFLGIRDIVGDQAYFSLSGSCHQLNLGFTSLSSGYTLTSISSRFYPAPSSPSGSNIISGPFFFPYSWLIQGEKPPFPSHYSGFVAGIDFRLEVSGIEQTTTRNLTVNYLYTDNTPAAESVTYPFEPGAEFNIPSPEIPGYLPNRSVVSGIMPEEDASIDVFYNQLFYPLTIQYQYVDGTQASEDAVANYPMGFEYGVPSPEINGYTPSQKMVSGIMPAQAVTETVTYVGKPYTLTVIYQYENGLQATDTYQGRFITGSRYSIPSPRIEGYAPSEEAVTGTMPGKDVTRTVVYRVDSGDSSGAGDTGPGGGGESGGGDKPGGGTQPPGDGEFTGNDPFVLPEIPPFSGKNPFVLPDFSSSGGNSSTPGIPPYPGRDPFRIYGLPPYFYDPFVMPDSLREQGRMKK